MHGTSNLSTVYSVLSRKEKAFRVSLSVRNLLFFNFIPMISGLVHKNQTKL